MWVRVGRFFGFFGLFKIFLLGGRKTEGQQSMGLTQHHNHSHTHGLHHDDHAKEEDVRCLKGLGWVVFVWL